jgi:ABC-type amino acid transport substrate-binding protein
MKRSIAALLAAVVLAGASPAFAQDAAARPGPVVVTLIPAGGTFFTEGKDLKGPSFGNYDLGGAVAVNVNRYVGIEGEVSGALGVSQNLQFSGVTADRRTPHILNYSGNLVVSAPNRSAVVPYITGGIGGLSLYEKADLGITGTETFLTGNVGGGLAWYSGRWGLRGDYRFVAVRSRDDAPAFFGRETRYGHRVYAGLMLNTGR